MRKRCVGSCSWREYCSAISLCVATATLTLQVGGCMCVSVSLSVSLFVGLSACLPVCLSVCLSVCAHVRRVIAKGEMSPHLIIVTLPSYPCTHKCTQENARASRYALHRLPQHPPSSECVGQQWSVVCSRTV